VAAGSLIVDEAGGKVTDYFGGQEYLFGKSIIAGNPQVQEQMRQIIAPYLEGGGGTFGG